MKKYVYVVLFVVVSIIFIFIKSCTTGEDEIVFSDKVFEAMMKSKFDKDKIYPSDLANITGITIAADRVLEFSGKGFEEKSIILYGFTEYEYDGVRYEEYGTMTMLDDLKNFPKLSSVRVYLQPNIDFNTIPNRGNIYNLGLNQNKISKLDFLEGYTKLKYLWLSSNELVDITGVENVKTVTNINFNSNDIEDISLLSNLTDLKYIDLTYNKVVNLTPLANLKNLEYLSLYENGLSDITPLANIKSLKNLYLNNNNITDVSPLSGFTSFENLNLTNNPIINIEVLDHIENITK